MPFLRRFALLAASLTLLSTVGFAQRAEPTRALTAADYAHAEQFLNYNAVPLALHSGVHPTWVRVSGDERFWYVVVTEKGHEAFLVDPARRTRVACDLPECRRAEEIRPGRSAERRAPRSDAPSPDGKRTVFIRDWNLWVRDVATAKESPLTTDGVKDFGYATDNAGWTRSDRPIIVWSPDSRKIATFQQDQRGTGEMYLVDTAAGHPHLQAWKYPLPGDATVTTIERVVIDVDAAQSGRL